MTHHDNKWLVWLMFISLLVSDIAIYMLLTTDVACPSRLVGNVLNPDGITIHVFCHY